MERIVAINKLRKLLGPKVAWRINPKAPTADEREAAKLAVPVVRAERDALLKQRDARRDAILAADAEYQNLNTAYQAARKVVEKTSSLTYSYKIEVMTLGLGGIFYVQEAQGDSWEEIFAKLLAKKKAA